MLMQTRKKFLPACRGLRAVPLTCVGVPGCLRAHFRNPVARHFHRSPSLLRGGGRAGPWPGGRPGVEADRVFEPTGFRCPRMSGRGRWRVGRIGQGLRDQRL